MQRDKIRDSLSFLMVQVIRTHRRQIANMLSEHGLYVGQEMVLNFLWEQDGLTMSELVDRLDIKPPSATKMIGRMAQASLVETRPSSTDARVKQVFLTAEGRRLRQHIETAWETVDNEMFSHMSATECEQFSNTLKEIHRNQGAWNDDVVKVEV
jgi:DNA-binding MarR family transcriptional regulator